MSLGFSNLLTFIINKSEHFKWLITTTLKIKDAIIILLLIEKAI